MTKYTKENIKQSLKLTQKAKDNATLALQKIAELEKVFTRIENAMYNKQEFKEFLKNRLEEIKQDLIKEKPYYTKSSITMTSETKHKFELMKVYPYARDTNYEQYLKTVEIVQDKDRQHYIKKGEIEQ